MPSTPRAPAWLLPALAILLFFSGLCALVYQVLWLRLLSLTFGVTTHAASTVLASFMGGLAVGSFLAGRLADRSPRPLRLFGLVELLIGACALATPLALSGVHHLYISLFQSLPDSLVIATIARFVLSLSVLIVPTALMGATMPIVIKSSLSRMDAIGGRIGVLYASNTAGAIAGTLAAGFYLVPQVGLSRSFLIAASINGAIGLCALAIAARRFPAASASQARANDDDVVATSSAAPGAMTPVLRVVLVVFAISGFASLALEVIWFRLLGIILGPTSYAFTLMLSAVLAGIALGSAIIAPIMRLPLNWIQVLAVLQVGAGLVALRSFLSLRRAPAAPDWVVSLVPGAGLDYIVPAAMSSLVAIFPTALFFGLAFPVGLRLVAEATDSRHTAQRIGLLYSINVFGAILGSVGAGFVLLPWLGTRTSLIAMAGLFVVSGVALQLLLARRWPSVTTLGVAAVAALFFFQAGDVPDPNEIARRRARMTGDILFHEEGVQTSVSVMGGPALGRRILYLNGHHQANDTEGMVFIHRRIGLLPAALHPSPRRALAVGLGGGVTPGGLSQVPGLSLDVIELSEGVVRGAAFFREVNFNLLENPNVHVRVDDGRNFLLRVRTPYDVITADAILPHHAGSNNVNSREYFQLVRDALAPDGVALHWNGGATATEYKMILRAFIDVFPHATLWGDGALMVGTKTPLTVSQSRIDAKLADPAWRPVLALMHVEAFDHLVRMFRASPADIRAYVGPGPMLTDDKPALEYFASLPQDERDLTKIGRDATGVIRP